MSTNLSKQNREVLLNDLDKLKNKYNEDKELKNLISKIKNELNSKKYGLVWEEHSEKVDTELETKIPVFKENKKLEIKKDSKYFNFLLEGDNLHSLYLLEKTHKGKIDTIYIDPPYNTKSDDFKYDDSFVDPEDGFRHSKWLSFMEKRLRIAKNLMSKRGVMFISIDDNEVAPLKMLCDDIFGEDYTDIMIWRKSGVGRDGKMKNTTTFRKDHEYIITCFKEKKILNKIKELPDFVNKYPNPDNDPRGAYKAGSISRKESASNPEHKNYYTVVAPGGRTFTRQFDISKEEFEKLCNDKMVNKDGKEVSRIYWGKDDNSCPSIKIFVDEVREITPYSLLLSKGTTTEGTKELNSILNGDYSRMRPKPSLLIKTLIQLGSKKNSIVLDFFAGSGTTGQAVMELNEDDNGKRRFILCTNNEVDRESEKNFIKQYDITPDKLEEYKHNNNTEWENWCEKYGICTQITYKRLFNVINGYTNDKGENIQGLSNNLKYYKTEFVKKFDENDDIFVTNELEKIIGELVQLEYGIDINNSKVKIILSDDDMDSFISNKKDLNCCEYLFISRNTMIDEEQLKCIEENNIKLEYIPEYYFRNEIMEVNEW